MTERRPHRFAIALAGLLLLPVLLAPQCREPAPAWDFPDVCEPGRPPDESCFVTKRVPRSAEVALAVALANRWVDEHPPEEQSWDWGEGVLMFALSELHRVTGESRFRDYYRAWIDHHLLEGYDIMWSDSCPPALTALALYQDFGDPAYRQVVEAVIHYLDHVAARTPEGGISHLGSDAIFEATLWLDSLFMFGMVLTRWGEETGDDRFLDLLGEQFRIFFDALQAPGGLLYHAYNWPAAPTPDVFWGRGNGWVTASGYDYLRARRLRGERDRDVERLLATQVEAVVATQDATGLWWTVMDRPGEIYLETSAAALFVYGLARGYRYGLLDETVLQVARDALTGLEARITWDASDRPVVTGISGPTTAGSLHTYESVPLLDDVSYGVGATILALVETSGLPGVGLPE